MGAARPSRAAVAPLPAAADPRPSGTAAGAGAAGSAPAADVLGRGVCEADERSSEGIPASALTAHVPAASTPAGVRPTSQRSIGGLRADPVDPPRHSGHGRVLRESVRGLLAAAGAAAAVHRRRVRVLRRGHHRHDALVVAARRGGAAGRAAPVPPRHADSCRVRAGRGPCGGRRGHAVAEGVAECVWQGVALVCLRLFRTGPGLMHTAQRQAVLRCVQRSTLHVSRSLHAFSLLCRRLTAFCQFVLPGPQELGSAEVSNWASPMHVVRASAGSRHTVRRDLRVRKQPCKQPGAFPYEHHRAGVRSCHTHTPGTCLCRRRACSACGAI